jgi:uncharacterized protein involved in outer membrane biogenesis
MKNKKIIFIVFLVIVCLFALSVIKDLIIRSIVTLVASGVTGTEVNIGGFSLGIITRSVRISGFKMYNPQGFPRGLIVDLPRVNVDYNLLPLLMGKLHLRMVDIELKELGLEKNQQGELNVDSLKVVQGQAKPKAKKEKKPGKPLTIQIDLLNLQMGRIVFKDYSAGTEPVVQVYDINLKKSYKNITSAQQLVALILSEPMKQAGIKGAAIYGAAILTGVGIIPVAIAASFGGKDSVQQDLNINIDRLYDVSLDVLKRIGKVKKGDKTARILEAEVDKSNVTVQLKQISGTTTQITISARKYLLPKREIANGVLYQISEQLKR